MDKALAKKMLPVVNNQDDFAILLSYVDNRIEVMRGYLENTKDRDKILEFQGAIAELRRFQTLREQAIEGAK